MILSENKIRPPKLIKLAEKCVVEDLKIFRNKKFIKINCPTCNSKKLETYLTKNKFQFQKCINCSMVFQNPRPSPETLEFYYKNATSLALWDTIFKKTKHERKEKIFKPRVKLIFNILKQYKIKKCKKLVEVGSGYGWLLEVAKEMKLSNEIITIEPFPLYANACRKISGVEVIELTIEEQMKKNTKLNADLLVNFEVISLLSEPKSFLKYCFDGLRKDGIFIGSTVNSDGLDVRLLKEKGDSFAPNFLNLFNPKSIVKLMTSIGFKKVGVITPGLMDVDIMINKIKYNKINPDNFPFFKLISDSSPDFKEDLQQLLQKYKMSSHMVFFGQK